MSIEKLKIISFDNKNFNLKNFDCGNQILNDYLIKYASQDIKRYLSSGYICVDEEDEVVGYYTLSANRVDISELPQDYSSRLPAYPYLPAILIGRLAVARSCHNLGIGEFLLTSALKKASKSEIAAFAVIVEAKNQQAINFYKKYGFMQLKDNKKLFLSMKIISQLFE